MTRPRASAFLTEYPVGRGRYGAEIWARSWRDADRKAKARGLREKVIGRGVLMTAPLPSVVLRSRRPLHEKVHALCYLGMLACAARVATWRDFFGDEEGVLHALVHSLELRGLGGPPIGSVVRRVEAIERAVPGLRPPASVLPRRPWRKPPKPGQRTITTKFRARTAA